MKRTKYTVSLKKKLTENTIYFKTIASLVTGYILLFFIITNYQSVSQYFTRFPMDGFEEVLTNNSALLAEMEVDEIRFVTDNYSGNAAGKQATSLTIYGQPSLMDNKIYLSTNASKLSGIKAVLKDGKWIVYGIEKTKEFKKQEIKKLVESSLLNFIEAKKKIYDNQKAWTEKPSKNVKL